MRLILITYLRKQKKRKGRLPIPCAFCLIVTLSLQGCRGEEPLRGRGAFLDIGEGHELVDGG